MESFEQSAGKFNPGRKNKLVFLLALLIFGVIGGVIALVASFAAEPLVIDTSVPQPQNVQVWANDRTLTVTWDYVARDDVIGYYLQYKKKGAPTWENVRQSTRASIQLQPLENGVEYEITIQSARGSYLTTPKGDIVNHDSSANIYWPRADGHVSLPVTVGGTPSSAQRVAQAARLTGFYDDFNEPANPFNELKWNQAAFCLHEKDNALAFINPQFHSHNGIHCGFGGITSRPRNIWDTSVGVNGGPLSESNPAHIEFDQDLIYDSGRSAWYLDLMPLDSTLNNQLQDVNARHDIHNDDDEAPANMMRIQASNFGMFYNWYGMNRLKNRLNMQTSQTVTGCWQHGQAIDFRGCNMTQKSADFSGGLPRQTNTLFQSAQNVRRHWVIQITPTRMKTFIDNVLMADAALPAEFAVKRKFIVQNTMFSYNTAKGFETSTGLNPDENNPNHQRYKGRQAIIPWAHFYHWDNFGFTGPAPTTVVHNYLDSGPDGRTPNYLNNAGTDSTNRQNRTTIINIPDPLASPVGGVAKLYYSLGGSWFNYKWTQGDHFIVNGRRHDVPNPIDNLPTAPPRYYTDGLGHAQVTTVMQQIPINELVQGNNTLTFNFGANDSSGTTSNLHLELEYTKGTEPSYTHPIDYFRSVGNGDMFSHIVEPRLTNCDSFIYVEQDINLPYLGGKANLPVGPCEFLPHGAAHQGVGRILNLTNFEAEDGTFAAPITSGDDPNASKGKYIRF